MEKKRLSSTRLKWVALIALLLLYTNAFCEELYLKGAILNGEDYKGVENMKVTLYKLGTDTAVVSTQSGEGGNYELKGFEPDNYTVKITGDGYLPASFDFQLIQSYEGVCLPVQPDPAIKEKELQEVVVIAEALKSYAGKYEMYLSDYNRNFGLNALDAISSLPKFIPKINGEALLNEKMDNVSILIDGRRADPEQLRNLTGKDIAKVIYYQDAPAQYAGLYGGAVANIILRRPKEIKITGKLDTSTALSTAYTSDRAGFSMLTPYSLLNATYNFQYRNNNQLQTQTTYDYGDLIDDFSSRNSRKEGKGNRATLSYQLERGKNLFYTQFGYVSSDNHVTYDEKLLEKTPMKEIIGKRLSTNHRTSDILSLNLYWARTFGTGRELMVDVVGTITKTRNNAKITQDAGEDSAYGDFVNDSYIDGLVRSVIANASYTTPLWGGSGTVSISDIYRHVHQNYIDNFFPELPSLNVSSNNYATMALGYNRQFGRLNTSLNILLLDNMLRTADATTHNDFNIYPRLNLMYTLSNVVGLQLMVNTEGSLHGVGQQNINRSFLDTRYFRENIPYMKPTRNRAMRNYFQLSLGYTFNAGKAKRKSTRAKMLYNEDHESGI